MVTYKINTRWNKKTKKNGGGNQGGYPAFKDKGKKKSVKDGERGKGPAPRLREQEERTG